MHLAAYEFIVSAADRYQATGPVYEIGSRNINGSVRPIFAGLPYVGVDLTPGLGVDVVADAAFYQPVIRPATVVCCEVLEHSPNAAAIVRQAADVLLPGGLLLITTADEGRPPHSGVDGGTLRDGEYYENLTAGQLLSTLLHTWIKPLLLQADGQDLRLVGRKER